MSLWERQEIQKVLFSALIGAKCFISQALRLSPTIAAGVSCKGGLHMLRQWFVGRPSSMTWGRFPRGVKDRARRPARSLPTFRAHASLVQAGGPPLPVVLDSPPPLF